MRARLPGGASTNETVHGRQTISFHRYRRSSGRSGAFCQRIGGGALSTDLSRVLWANGAAAGLFSTGNIYDFIDAGLPAADVMTRQLQAAARQLSVTGDTRSVSLRIASGFRSTVVVATLSLVEIHAGERAVLFAAPVSATAPAARDCAVRMISGFDDPDTHMAVLDGDGMVLAASEGFCGARPAGGYGAGTHRGSRAASRPPREAPDHHGSRHAAGGHWPRLRRHEPSVCGGDHSRPHGSDRGRAGACFGSTADRASC